MSLSETIDQHVMAEDKNLRQEPPSDAALSSAPDDPAMLDMSLQYHFDAMAKQELDLPDILHDPMHESSMGSASPLALHPMGFENVYEQKFQYSPQFDGSVGVTKSKPVTNPLTNSAAGGTSNSSNGVNNSNVSGYKPPFVVDLNMIRRTMDGLNAALGVDLAGTEVSESALLDHPNPEEEGEGKEQAKGEMSHVRLISDACGHIVASVGRAVLAATQESVEENYMRGAPLQAPKAPIRKKRGGILGFKELATRVNLSPWHFHRVFRFVTGVTPKAYGEALWEYLMIEAGFDLENEDLTINQAIKAKGPTEGPAAANKLTNSPSSSSSSPQSPLPATHTGQLQQHPHSSSSSHMNLDNNMASQNPGSAASRTSSSIPPPPMRQRHHLPTKSLSSISLDKSIFPEYSLHRTGSNVGLYSMAPMPLSGTAPAGGVSMTVTGPSSNSLSGSNSLTSNSSSGVAPLAGPVAPGRVQKNTSRSRGARSRSHNRSQTQSQMLAGLSLESSNDVNPIARGRSFSHVSERPRLVSGERALQNFYGGALDAGAQSSAIDSDSSSPLNAISGMTDSFGGADSYGRADLMLHTHQFDVPDVNGLSTQKMDPPRGRIGVPSSMPTSNGAPGTPAFDRQNYYSRLSSPDTTQQYGYPAQQQQQSYGMPMMDTSNGVLDNGVLDSSVLDNSVHENGVLDNSVLDNSVLNNGAPDAVYNDAILADASGPLVDQPTNLHHAGSHHSIQDLHPRNMPMAKHSEDSNLHDSLQHEMMNQKPGDAAAGLDQLGDLPTYFYMSSADKSLYNGDSNGVSSHQGSSAMLGEEDPPLMPAWGGHDSSLY